MRVSSTLVAIAALSVSAGCEQSTGLAFAAGEWEHTVLGFVNDEWTVLNTERTCISQRETLPSTARAARDLAAEFGCTADVTTFDETSAAFSLSACNPAGDIVGGELTLIYESPTFWRVNGTMMTPDDIPLEMKLTNELISPSCG